MFCLCHLIASEEQMVQHTDKETSSANFLQDSTNPIFCKIQAQENNSVL
jgi:hypothetical protein